MELDASGRPGKLHVMPIGPISVRWAALFSSPFFHPSVLVDREVLETHGLRYDPEYLESEDYELWTRLLLHAEGDNLAEPLLLYRVHAGQASQARRGFQRDFQRRVALREIGRVAPALDPEHVELAWRVGAGHPIESERTEEAVQPRTSSSCVRSRRLQQSVAKPRGAREGAGRTLARLALDSRRGQRVGSCALRCSARSRCSRRSRRPSCPTATPRCAGETQTPDGWTTTRRSLARRCKDAARTTAERLAAGQRRLPRANSVPGAAARSRRRPRGSRPDGGVRCRDGRRPDVARRAPAPGGVPPRRTCCPVRRTLLHHDYHVTPGHRRGRCRCPAGRRRRLRLEHVRRPGGHRLVPSPAGAVRPGRREP